MNNKHESTTYCLLCVCVCHLATTDEGCCIAVEMFGILASDTENQQLLEINIHITQDVHVYIPNKHPHKNFACISVLPQAHHRDAPVVGPLGSPLIAAVLTQVSCLCCSMWVSSISPVEQHS